MRRGTRRLLHAVLHVRAERERRAGDDRRPTRAQIAYLRQLASEKGVPAPQPRTVAEAREAEQRLLRL